MKKSKPLRIQDFKDPTGSGMFSRLGRATSNRHSIFKRKEELFHNNVRYIKTKKIADFNVVVFSYSKIYHPIDHFTNSLDFEGMAGA